MAKIFIFIALGLFPGCVTAPQHSTDRINQVRTHIFEISSAELVIEAIKQQFRRINEAPNFSSIENGICVVRPFKKSGYDIRETWNFTVKPFEPNSVQVTAEAKGEFGRVSFMTFASPRVYRPVNFFPYELLFSRIEYLLGQREKWETCAEYKTRTGLGDKFYGDYFDFLCWGAEET